MEWDWEEGESIGLVLGLGFWALLGSVHLASERASVGVCGFLVDSSVVLLRSDLPRDMGAQRIGRIEWTAGRGIYRVN